MTNEEMDAVVEKARMQIDAELSNARQFAHESVDALKAAIVLFHSEHDLAIAKEGYLRSNDRERLLKNITLAKEKLDIALRSLLDVEKMHKGYFELRVESGGRNEPNR